MAHEPGLEQILQQLQASGISAGLESTPDGGMHVWIGDTVRRIEETTIEQVTTGGGRQWRGSDVAAHWLSETAARLFPETRFGLECRARHRR